MPPMRAQTADSLTPDIDTIFSHGGVELGVETLSFDLGPAKVEGTGPYGTVARRVARRGACGGHGA